jgi:hypothetical protein
MPLDGNSKPNMKAAPVGGRFLKEAREGGIERQDVLDAAPLNQSSLEKSVLPERNFHFECHGLFITQF